MASSVGKEFRAKGYRKNKPVLIIPGISIHEITPTHTHALSLSYTHTHKRAWLKDYVRVL